MPQRTIRLFVLVLFVFVSMSRAQSAASKPAEAPAAPPAGHTMHGGSAPGGPSGHMTGTPKAAPADVASPDAVVTAYYESLAGPAGKKRDWNRFLSLFYHGARLLPAEGKGHSGTMPMDFTPYRYLFDTEPTMLESGYIPKEVARRSETFGKILQAFSTYEVRHTADDPKPFVRGVNSFQLFFDGKRWWIYSVIWQPETPNLALPDALLHS
ncbi:MAG TPA: hypothetical protein VH988_20675 [Thermoanaerobaculia bacterium]|jgi:hypothetical protein|nr:hypothetical protein [Thermoanaerobaculia bacterium]